MSKFLLLLIFFVWAYFLHAMDGPCKKIKGFYLYNNPWFKIDRFHADV